MWPDGIRDGGWEEPLGSWLPWREQGCRQGIFNGWPEGHSLGAKICDISPHTSQTLIFFSDSWPCRKWAPSAPFSRQAAPCSCYPTFFWQWSKLVFLLQEDNSWETELSPCWFLDQGWDVLQRDWIWRDTHRQAGHLTCLSSEAKGSMSLGAAVLVSLPFIENFLSKWSTPALLWPCHPLLGLALSALASGPAPL